MIAMAACWGLGFAALLVAAATYGWFTVDRYITHTGRNSQAVVWAGRVLGTVGTILLWAGIWSRSLKGHGWPFVSSADTALGIASLLLFLHMVWSLLSHKQETSLFVTIISLALLAFAFSQFPHGPVTRPLMSKASLLSQALYICAGGLLALAAATSLSHIVRTSWLPRPVAPGTLPQKTEEASEMLVRTALLCLAVGLAIDTWWLQKVGLGTENDAQQAGIAIAWMVYFVAVRLRSSPRWRGWPWVSVLIVGFVCTLPILIDVPWLGNSLPI